MILDDLEVKDGLTDEDHVPDVEENKTPVTKLGDVWTLGNHRIMCGDSTNIDDVDKLLNGESIDCIYSDPPYGISLVQGNTVGGSKEFGNVSAKNGTCKRIIDANEYMPIAGDDSIQTAIDFYSLCKSLNVKQICLWGANYYSTHLEDNNKWLFWDKNTTGNFADGELAWFSFKGKVEKFTHTWNGLIKQSEKKAKRVHPTQKPVALADHVINNIFSNINTLFDGFLGSGSTLIACEQNNISCFGMELEPYYCDVIIKRWQEYTGKEAYLDFNGKSYCEMESNNG